MVQVGIWKLRGETGGMVRDRCLLCIEESISHLCVEESISHLLVKWPETEIWRGELLHNKWSHINKEKALRKTLTVKTVNEQRHIGTVSYKIKCKWKNQVKKGEMRLGERENYNVSSINSQ